MGVEALAARPHGQETEDLDLGRKNAEERTVKKHQRQQTWFGARLFGIGH
jgi:hypothetical protein